PGYCRPGYSPLIRLAEEERLPRCALLRRGSPRRSVTSPLDPAPRAAALRCTGASPSSSSLEPGSWASPQASAASPSTENQARRSDGATSSLSSHVHHQAALVGTYAVFPDIKALPGPECQTHVADRDRLGGACDRALGVGGHVVGALVVLLSGAPF